MEKAQERLNRKAKILAKYAKRNEITDLDAYFQLRAMAGELGYADYLIVTLYRYGKEKFDLYRG